MDIGCPIDTPVKAAASGKVIYSGWKDIFGNMVIIKHDRGYISVYAHNKTNIVREDDLVKAGDIIARSGMTGSVTGPHLHFEIRKHLTPLNPRRFLR
jgi:murein DD-endopeptidase MepM/ murein hydrolase activator NlpD